MPWDYDFPHSRIGFIASHFGFIDVHGRFQKADVKLDLNDADPTKSTIDVTIDAASLTTDFPRRDDAVLKDPYLDVEHFPTITFKSKRVESRGGNRYAVVGDFTMHGVTRELVLDTVYNGEATDARGNTLRGLAARATIKKGDYGIKGSPVEPNVAEEIKLLIDIELHKRDA